METRMMSKSPITTDGDWLKNSHAGDLLVSEFMDPLDLSAEVLAAALGLDIARVMNVITGKHRIDADFDLRLSRYFRMSEGFFMGLQDDYELLEAKRALNGQLDQIVPRAA